MGPYRPHLPYPISYWAYVLADLQLEQEPTNPTDGEQVTAVHVLPATEAIQWLSVCDDGPLLEVVRLAHELGVEADYPRPSACARGLSYGARRPRARTTR